MESILDLLNSSRQLTFFPLIQAVALAVMVGGALLAAGMAFCREEVKAALHLAGISQKEAAITLGVSETVLSHKLDGTKRLTFESLEKMPTSFWQAFAVVLSMRYGVPPVIQAGMALAHHNEMAGAL